MSLTSNPVTERTWHASFSPSAQVLRQWSAPGMILAVTNFADEDILLLHAIRQARRGDAKVVLVHVLPFENVPSYAKGWNQPGETNFQAESALEALNRMSRQLRWVGIACEPLLLRGSAAKEIPHVARAHGAERILLAAGGEQSAKGTVSKTLAEELLPEISVPICTVRQYFPKKPFTGDEPGTITLALSLHSDTSTPLAFATRLAQEYESRLKVVHVLESEDKDAKELERTPLAFASRLPADRLREAELLCPLEIAVRRGDPATEILKSGSYTNQDFIVLGLVGHEEAAQARESSIVHRVICEARCPVIVLGELIGESIPR